MNKYYRRLFFGLVLIFFDLYVIRIDILPNIIGYVTIAAALGALALKDAAFEGGKIIAWILVAMEFIEVYLRWSGQSLVAVNTMANKLFLFSQGLTFLNFLLIYFICKGTYNLTPIMYNEKKEKRIKLLSKISWLLYGVAVIAAITLNYIRKISAFPNIIEDFKKVYMVIIGLAILFILAFIFISAMSFKPRNEEHNL